MQGGLLILLLFTLQLFCFFVGRKQSTNRDNSSSLGYFIAGKTVTFFPLMMTFLATQVGGGVILGDADEAYRHGWLVLCYPLGTALGLLFLGAGFGQRLSSFSVTTIAQLMEVGYKSTLMKRVVSIFSMGSMFLILVAQVLGSQRFLAASGADYWWVLVGFWSIVIAYTAKGGMRGVIATDIVQASFFFVVFATAFIYTFVQIPYPQLCLDFNVATSTTPEWHRCYGWLIMPMLFMLIRQDMGQRCLAGKSAKTVATATAVSALLTMLIGIIPVFLGIFARISGLIVPEGASTLMTLLSDMTPPWLQALVGCAVLAAIISTATSLINAMSANLCTDFYSSATKGEKNKMAPLFSALIAIGAIGVAFFFKSILQLLVYSYEVSVCCFWVPVVWILFKREGNPFSAWLAIITGATALLVVKLTLPAHIPYSLGALATSLASFLVGEWICARKLARAIAK